MEKNRKLQKSKLRFAGSSDIINRDRLSPFMDEFTQKRVTSVVAGAGYGKSTFVFQAVQYADIKTIWYRLDQYDRDIVTFISYMVSGLRTHYPDIAQKTLDSIDAAPVSAGEIEAVFFLFLNDIENIINEKIIFVLDDYHLVHDSDEINKFLNLFLENLPLNIHLAITSRVEPELRFSQYRARRGILEIKETDLEFSDSEIDQFFSHVFHLSLKKENIQTLYQKTNGWVSALILFYHGLKKKNPKAIEASLQNLKGSHRIISNYLEENIYENLPEEIKIFLLKTSLFSSIRISVCNKALSIKNSRGILSDLEKKHLFTFSMDENQQEYFYHHLFQDFLQKKLSQEFSRKDILDLHIKIASIFEKTGEEEEALRFYLSGEQYESASRIFISIHREMVTKIQSRKIKFYLEQFPESYANSDPWILYVKGQLLLRSRREINKGIECCEKALNLFQEQGNQEGLDICTLEFGFSCLHTMELHKAEKIFKGVLGQNTTEPYYKIRALAHLLHLSALHGRMNEADQYTAAGLGLLADIKDPDRLVNARGWLYLCMGWRYIVSGDFKKALKYTETGQNELKGKKNIQLTAWFHCLASEAYYQLFNFYKGYRNAEEGLHLMKNKSLEKEIVPTLLLHYARNCLGLGRINEAIKNAQESLRIFHEAGHILGQAGALLCLHDAYSISGNVNSAEQCLKEFALCIKGCSETLFNAVYQLITAASLVEKKKFAQALEIFKATEKKAAPWKFVSCILQFSFTKLYWKQSQKGKAIQKGIKTLQFLKENEYDLWIVIFFPWIIPLLLEIIAKGKMQDYLQNVFTKVGFLAIEELIRQKQNQNVKIREAASLLLMAIPAPPPPGLKVYCLGEFKLFRGETEINEKEWRYKKSKQLFKYLLLMRDRGYQPKEVLMELLWPEEDFDKASNRLRVVMTSLRKVLEPNLERGIASSYILTRKDSYKLDLGMNGWTDLDEFKRELEFAEKNKNNPSISIQHYLKAESVYTGEFMEEDLYEEWCAAERDRFREKYLDLLTKIISIFKNKKEYKKCITYANKYLTYDKYAEQIYQTLMVCYARLANTAMVLDTYDKCQKNIVDDLCSPLKKETEELYTKLIVK